MEGTLGSLEAVDVQRCGGWVLFAGRVGGAGGYTLRAICMLLEVLEALEVAEVMHCVPGTETESICIAC